MTNDGKRYVLTYNGEEVDAVFSGLKNSYGIYCNCVRLDVDGTCVAASATEAALSAADDGLFLNEVDMLTNGKCINITMADYNRLLSGEIVQGYKRYSRNAIYNIVDYVSQAQTITYTVADGIITFSGGATAKAAEDVVYNNASGLLTENTLDKTLTVTNTRCPFVIVRRFDPIILVNGKITLHYYVDTQTMSKLKENTISDTFTVIVKTAGGSVVKKTTYAGEFTIETPAFTSAGETWFSVECIDSNRVGSAVQYFDILVRNSALQQVYTMTEQDLTDHGIVTRDDDSPISVADAIANKAALTNFFSYVKTRYDAVKMLKRIYWVDYHAIDGVGTQTFYKCEVTDGHIMSVVTVTEQAVIDAGVQTKSRSSSPMVGDVYNKADGIYYFVFNTSESGDPISFPDGFTVDLNGSTLAATQCTDISGGDLLSLNNNFDTHIINGFIKGPYEGFDFPTAARRIGNAVPSEWLYATRMHACRYCSFENLDISGSVGYDGSVTAMFDSHREVSFNDGQRVDLDTGEIVSATGFVTTKKIDISNFTPMGGQPNKYLAFGRSGYCGYENQGTQRECFVSFYDSSNAYIGSVKTKLFYLVSIPENAVYVIITGYGKVYSDNDPNAVDWKIGTDKGVIRLHQPKLSRGIVIKDCHWHDTRTTAMSYLFAQNVLMEGCTYTNIAIELGKYGVTRILGAFEDSWSWLQGVKMSNLSCVKGAGSNYFVANYATALEFCGCSGIYFDIAGGVEDGFFENNDLPRLDMTINSRSYHPHVVYKGNHFGVLRISTGDGALGSPDKTVPMIDTTIDSVCAYEGLRLINSINGGEKIDR